ncbi:sugar ABC transporter ATP-binding protein [Tomitella gaofuii]|uniref:sugar ABC transporter ATP-binding protein n=1 Tax=Tomitella gaofuii TaxID=2760083 RepID=UPI001F199F01|nr:sugar ABC transporter ATP-binding protein [Tomitella gaofuii]
MMWGRGAGARRTDGPNTLERDADDTSPVHLQLRGVGKVYPGVRALDGVDFDVHGGEVHVLLGENGAGKSTLIKMMAGVHRPDSGEMRMDGRPVHLHGPGDAEALGISTIHQEMSLVPQLTVAENIYLGRQPRRLGIVDVRTMRRRARELLAEAGLAIDADATVSDLGVAQRQLVEIAKALSIDTRILVMDEPTAVLSAGEVDALFAIVDDLRSRGVGVVFISHLLDEVARIGDRVTVLRDGGKVGEVPASTGVEELVRLMVGRTIDQQYPRRDNPVGEPVLQVTGLSSAGRFEEVDLEVRAGEVVGIGGLVGAGRTEVARAVFGADHYDAGRIAVAGAPVRGGDVVAAYRAGIALVPEDRAGQGLVLGASVEENLCLATLAERTSLGLVDRREQRRQAVESVRRMGIKVHSIDQPAMTLSGGNQQKIVIGKWLMARPRVLILDEPSRGIDVGARAEIYALIGELTAQGAAILVISSDLPELLGLSDRVLVMADGRIRGELSGDDATQERVMALAVTEG